MFLVAGRLVIPMGLTAKKEEQLKKMPNIETRVRKSRDGRFLIHQTVITHVKPVAYYNAVLSGEEVLDVEDVEELADASA